MAEKQAYQRSAGRKNIKIFNNNAFLSGFGIFPIAGPAFVEALLSYKPLKTDTIYMNAITYLLVPELARKLFLEVALLQKTAL